MPSVVTTQACERETSRNHQKSFAVAPVKLPDIRRLVDIEFHAFENERVNQVLSYRDYKKPLHFQRTMQIYETTLIDDIGPQVPHETGDERLEECRQTNGQSESKIIFKKVVNIPTSEIVSFTKYEIKTYSKAELESPLDAGHHEEPKMNRDWFALNERLRREYVGTRKHCCEFYCCRSGSRTIRS